MSEDISPPDLFGHRAPLKAPRRRRVAEVQAPFAAPSPSPSPSPSPPPAPLPEPVTAPVPPSALVVVPPPPPDPRDALALAADGDDETLAFVAREAVRLLRRRIERATDSGAVPSRPLARAVEAIAAELAPEGAMADPDLDFAVPRAPANVAPKAARRR